MSPERARQHKAGVTALAVAIIAMGTCCGLAWVLVFAYLRALGVAQ